MVRLSSLVAFVAILATSPVGAQGPSATFHSRVELVALTVTVTDGGSRFVNDLSAASFSVLEDGVPLVRRLHADDRAFSPSTTGLRRNCFAVRDRLHVSQREPRWIVAARRRPEDGPSGVRARARQGYYAVSGAELFAALPQR